MARAILAVLQVAALVTSAEAARNDLGFAADLETELAEEEYAEVKKRLKEQTAALKSQADGETKARRTSEEPQPEESLAGPTKLTTATSQVTAAAHVPGHTAAAAHVPGQTTAPAQEAGHTAAAAHVPGHKDAPAQEAGRTAAAAHVLGHTEGSAQVAAHNAAPAQVLDHTAASTHVLKIGPNAAPEPVPVHTAASTKAPTPSPTPPADAGDEATVPASGESTAPYAASAATASGELKASEAASGESTAPEAVSDATASEEPTAVEATTDMEATAQVGGPPESIGAIDGMETSSASLWIGLILALLMFAGLVCACTPARAPRPTDAAVTLPRGAMRSGTASQDLARGRSRKETRFRLPTDMSAGRNPASSYDDYIADMITHEISDNPVHMDGGGGDAIHGRTAAA